VFSFLTTQHCPRLLLTAVLLWIGLRIKKRPRLLLTRRAAIDRYRLPAGHRQQTRREQ